MTDDAPKPYGEQLKHELERLIAHIDLPELSREMMRARWLDQVLWLEGRAKQTQRRYYALRLTAIIGGVKLPALAGLHLNGVESAFLRWFTMAVSLIVAICLAVEEFFHYGDRWRHYRQQAEQLKNEGWRFFQLAAPYDAYKSHAAAYPAFAARVEDLLREDVTTFVTQVAQEPKKEENGRTPGAGPAHAFAAPTHPAEEASSPPPA